MAAQDSASVLVVDDENGVRHLLARWLESGGFAVTTASTAEEGLSQLEAAAPAILLCDVKMPGHDGLWLAERARRQCPETAVIMASGVQDIAVVVESLRQGAVDYLTKPFGRDRLREAVARGLEWHRSAWDARRWRESLEAETALRRERLANAMSALSIDSDDALDAMLSTITLSDPDAYRHAHRVAQLAARLARVLGVEGQELRTLHRAALLHDLGKLAVPDAILRKPAPLTPDEETIVRRHPAIGRELASVVPYLAAASPIIEEAHEWVARRDGTAPPETHITRSSRIIAVADAFDTMIHPRAFRAPLTHADALRELERGEGTQFDPLVVDAFRTLTTD